MTDELSMLFQSVSLAQKIRLKQDVLYNELVTEHTKILRDDVFAQIKRHKDREMVLFKIPQNYVSEARDIVLQEIIDKFCTKDNIRIVSILKWIDRKDKNIYGYKYYVFGQLGDWYGLGSEIFGIEFFLNKETARQKSYSGQLDPVYIDNLLRDD